MAETSSWRPLYGIATPGNTAGHFQKLEKKLITFQWFIGTVRVGIFLSVPTTKSPSPIVRYPLASTKENHLKAKPVISKKRKSTSFT